MDAVSEEIPMSALATLIHKTTKEAIKGYLWTLSETQQENTKKARVVLKSVMQKRDESSAVGYKRKIEDLLEEETEATQSEKMHIRTAEEINLQSTTPEPPLP